MITPRPLPRPTACALLALIVLSGSLRPALGHVCDPGPLMIVVGKEMPYHITPDITETKATVYSVIGNTNPAVATTHVNGITQKGRVTFRVRGHQEGVALISIRWFYDHDPPMPDAEGVCIFEVRVKLPPASSANNLNFAIGGDPVNTRNGEFFADEAVDLNLRGPMELFFARYYASKLAEDILAPGTLGTNRRHNYEMVLSKPDETHANIVTARGRLIPFEKVKTAWVLRDRVDVPFQLVEEGTNFLLGDPLTQRIYTFSAAGRLTKIEDGRGNVHTLTYDGSGRLISVSDGLGRALTFAYDANGQLMELSDGTREVLYTYSSGRLASVVDALNQTTTYSYDAAGLMTAMTRPEGNTPFTQVFTAGKVTSQTERGTDTSTFSYGANTTTFTDPTGATLVDNYNASGDLLSHVDQTGKTISTDPDSTGRRSVVRDRLGRTASIVFHPPNGLPGSVTNFEQRVTNFAYQARPVRGLVFHDLTNITYPDGTTETLGYDARGNLLQRIDRANHQWNFTYNDHGQILTGTNPRGGVVTHTYDAGGNRGSSQDSGTGVTNYTYDALSRLTGIARPGGATATVAYDARDRITSYTDERGQTTTFVYDQNDRLTVTTDPDLGTTQFGYDALDRLSTVTDRVAAVRTVTYNSRRLLASFTDPNQNITNFTYDPRRRLTGLTDAGSQTWTQGYDDEDRLIGAATPINPPGTITRNALGLPIEISSPLGHTTRMVRDVMQRVTQVVDPLGRETRFTYDPRGDLVGLQEQGGGTAQITRDALGSVSTLLDPNGGSWAFTYTAEGRLNGLTDPVGKTWGYTYDNRGRLGQITYADGTTETLTYDAANHLLRRQFTDITDLQYTYDNLGRVITASGVTFTRDAESRLTKTTQNGVEFGAAYDPAGRLTSVSYNNGALTVTYSYDTRNRLTAVSDNVSGASVAFSYDEAGRPLTLNRGNGINATYTYDHAGRLLRIDDGTVLDLQYTLNAAGEITQLEQDVPLVSSITPSSETLAFNQAAEITTAGYTYDARGRLTAAPGNVFTWDGASRLTGRTGVALTYNAFGDIVTRTEGGTTTGFFHHHALPGAPIVAERDETTALFTRLYVCTPGGVLLYAIDPQRANAESYYHFDRFGTTLALTDEAGTISDSYAYGPFGEPLGHNGANTQPFTYLGALGVRMEGSLYQMRARYYDPKTARFLSRDPRWGQGGGVKELNPYAYANQNPLRYVDPDGGRTFVLPHVLEKDGGIANTQFTFDTTVFATYTGGLGSNHGNADASVDLYLFSENAGAIVTNGGSDAHSFLSAAVAPSSGVRLDARHNRCEPCNFTLEGARKRSVKVDELIADKGAGAFDGVTLSFGVVVVGGTDPSGVNILGFVVNAHTSPFSLSVFGFEPQAILAVGSP